ncbi:PaaX family transcriptional regulator C-terminal domain-containing protein [Streptomyces sp. NPDC058045]|uniref:PaaX family transcriptional regulator n=1 Tax=Streptomyces sp. NPDC058045 TaxID=3346311 RepID=UPI0036EB339D
MCSATDDDAFDPNPQGLLFSMFGAYLRPRTASMWSGGLVALLEHFDIANATARMTLNRMVHRGLAEPHRSGRAVHYTLTARSLHLLEDGDNRLSTLDAADIAPKTWTLVWHNLPDSRKAERSNFVKQLRFHGFGQMQDATWIAPKDYVEQVSAHAKLLGISEEVAVFRARMDRDVMPAAMLGRLWQLDELADRYQRFTRRYRQLAEGAPELTEEESFVACTEMLHTFRSFANLDPELPRLWTPHADARDEALSTYRGALDALRPRASAHFLSVTAAGSASA